MTSKGITQLSWNTVQNPCMDSNDLRELYQKSDPNVTTSVTVPVLWDKKTETIVNNESSQVFEF